MFDANLLATNPHIRYAESTRNGLALVTIDASAVNVEMIAVGDVTTPDDDAIDVVAFRTRSGSRSIERVT